MAFIQVPLLLQKWTEEDLELQEQLNSLDIANSVEPDFIKKPGLIQTDHIELIQPSSDTLSEVSFKTAIVTVAMPVEELIEMVLKNA